MINNKIYLKDYFPGIITSNASITSYCFSNHCEYPFEMKRKTILLIPGGGYGFVSFREGEPVAIKFMAENFNVFVLDYTVGDFLYPCPLDEAFAALVYIREHALEYNIDERYVGVMGFSAGGHLAASISCYWHEDYYASLLKKDKNLLRIDFTILSYPVTTTDITISHLDTRRRISQEREDLLDYFDIVKHVTPTYPPTFIWTTKQDRCVPFENSVLLKQALDRNEVKNQFVLYAAGDHGGATCDELTMDYHADPALFRAKGWIKKAAKFINEL